MMGLKESLLKYELQREIEAAKKLEKKEQYDKAIKHYTRAAAIYRRLAYNAPVEKAQTMFDRASRYENIVKYIRHRESVESLKEMSPSVQNEIIQSIIVSEKPETEWNEIGGLGEAKRTIKEAIILPFIESKPPFVKAQRTILLYGPPGTGKTLLAKAASNTLDATFFDARASSLLSKYFGESLKIIDFLFKKAKEMQPSVIFMDELDSLGVRRGADVSEATRRVVGQLLIEIDGFNTGREEKILIIAATNRPWELDEALISRFQKKIYVPLPDFEARRSIFKIHLSQAELKGVSFDKLAELTENFSGRDIANVCQEAIIRMVREENPELESLTSKQLEEYVLKYRPLVLDDFKRVIEEIEPSVKLEEIEKFEQWGKEGFFESKREEKEKLYERLADLERKKKSLEKAKEMIEKEFLQRTIEKDSFNKMLNEYEAQLIQIKAEIEEIKKELGKPPSD
ncbi:MAG: ATP-binding protein [Candidatus Aenigmatarchaeota archaeon]|nr:MAG: ATP-binding protein [Candidatus Aenigmarchaeota archaeon]RLJ07842.1 MAG: ATP-binding protein [Candidatus Aenigmarchaeota archaeon]